MPDELPEGHIQMADKFRGMTEAEAEAQAPTRRRRSAPVVESEPAITDQESDPDYFEDDDE